MRYDKCNTKITFPIGAHAFTLATIPCRDVKDFKEKVTWDCLTILTFYDGETI